MRERFERLADVLSRPWVSLVIGVVLVATALVEIVEDVDDIGAHHGLAVFGFLKMTHSLALLMRRDVVQVARAVDRLGRGGG